MARLAAIAAAAVLLIAAGPASEPEPAFTLADPGSLDGVPDATWAALALHHEAVVVLVDDPLERDPPRQRLPLLAGGRRIDPDLGSAAQRRRWHDAFPLATEQAATRLRARGVRVHLLSAAAPSQSWRVPVPHGGAVA